LRPTAQNDVALKAALEVIEHPGSRYNPLVVVGEAESGKTHLIHAIANAMREHNGRVYRVACTTGSEFVEELIAAVQQGTIERWRSKYRSCDVFVLDGFDALADKELSQDELFHLFNALAKRGAQLVFASRREPASLGTLAERVRSRLEGGLVVHLGSSKAGPRVTAEQVAMRLTPLNVTPVESTTTSATPPGVTDTFFLDPEKVLLDWPDADGLLVEEMR
jgi:chromosomal replication initiation ATPase DnaA